MAVDKINLRKLLQLLVADARQQRSLLLADIRNDRAKLSREKGKGGDFYTPFWAAVKDHAAGRSDISEQVEVHIKNNKTKKRLYPQLRDGFLEMWSEKIRWRNEPFEFVPEAVKTQYSFEKLGAIVKIENTASIVAWDGSHRIMYPYFYEVPPLTEDGARLGFWVLTSALPDYRSSDFRIIDFIRRAYYRAIDIRMNGNEEELFVQKYKALLELWHKLRSERA